MRAPRPTAPLRPRRRVGVVGLEPREPHRSLAVIEHDGPVDEHERGIRGLGGRCRDIVEPGAELVPEPAEPAEGRLAAGASIIREAPLVGSLRAGGVREHVEHGCRDRRRDVAVGERRGAGDRSACRIRRDELAPGMCGRDHADARDGIRSAVQPDRIRRLREPGPEDGLGVAPRGERA